MAFIDIFKHLLPRARAWNITASKQLREFFEGLTSAGDDVREFFDTVFTDIDPTETRELSTWETQFGLSIAGLTETQRRDKLSAAWAALGGQSPKYIQDTLQANGFSVYVHDWWVPGSEAAIGTSAAATIRDPLTYLVQTYPGDSAPPDGYPLVNIVTGTSNTLLVLAGEPLAAAGEPSAEAGNFSGFASDQKPYTIPTDTAYHPYFVYIGGSTFGTLASVDTDRRDELEALCLKLCPTHLWIGMLINYT